MRYFMKSLPKNKTAIIYTIALATILFAAILGVILGPTKLNLANAVSEIINGNTDSASARILLYVRLPRVLSSLACGAALAVSGGVIQGVLANNLASPSIIGVNSGAGLAVTLCSAFGIIGGWQLSLFSFAGAFMAAL